MKQKAIIYSIFRSKRCVVYAILFILLFMIGYIFSVNYDYYDYQINEVIGKKEASRGLVLHYEEDDVDDLINETLYIDEYLPLYEDENAKIGKKTYKINSDFKMNIFFGRSIEKDNELIISMLYFRTMKLNESDIGNKVIDLTINGKKYTFTIVGVTDDNHSHFYLSQNFIKDVLKLKANKYYLLVNTFSNVLKAIEHIEGKGYNIEYFDLSSIYEVQEVQKAKESYLYLCALIIICLILFLIGIIKNIFASETKNICLYKTIGFKNKFIKRIMVKRIAIIITFSYFIFLIMVSALSILINRPYISILSSFKHASIIYAIEISILLLTCPFIFKKFKRINIIENMK